ncbi:uncharacterized protein LOC132192385 isoform X2 [Neocloeon triangulifer]|uniref:uncharacterized protein LOC132192385 isoform X2 n=1 Tax=Neocloeon triangulifer TaxID=2078957 RepID=UPI00286EF9AD|nr:uncharacterized protein LOC132192385 isoform X2 [Neocloeon triangulifer]
MPAEVNETASENILIPNVPLMDYIIPRLREGLKTWPEDKEWIVDIPSGRSIKLSEVEPNAYKIASALTRLGIKHGEFVYFVTYELAQFFQIQIALYLLGVPLRGCHPTDKIENFIKQINEVKAKFIIVDNESIENVREALKSIDFPVQLISVGAEQIPETVHFCQLLKDDGSAFPNNVKINAERDVAVVINTSGSTGDPKGVVHTHKSILAGVLNLRNRMGIEYSMMEFNTNYGVISNGMLLHNLCHGVTTYHFTKFVKENLIENLLKYKPRGIIMYPHIAAWLAKQKEELNLIRQLDFLRVMLVGGWVIDIPTADTLCESLPNTHIAPIYGMSEAFAVAITDMRDGIQEKINRIVNGGKEYIATGRPLPNVQVKIVDFKTHEEVSPGVRGELLLKTPSAMAGYLSVLGKEHNRISFTKDNWLCTGDMAFVDNKGCIYIMERLSMHPDVVEAGVIALPDPQVESMALGFVVKRPGSKCTETELVKFVADKAPFFKQLHKGVRFMDALPIGLGGKVDRMALKRMAMEQIH